MFGDRIMSQKSDCASHVEPCCAVVRLLDVAENGILCLLLKPYTYVRE